MEEMHLSSMVKWVSVALCVSVLGDLGRLQCLSWSSFSVIRICVINNQAN